MHLSSWYLSDPKYGQGICPPGICLNQNMVQGFVLLAFVRTKSGSRHLSDPKVGPGICPPGICPIQKLVLEFVLRDIRPVLVFFLQGICQGRKMPGPGICLLAMYWDWLHSLIKSKDNYVKVFDTYSPIFGRTNASSQFLVRTNPKRTNTWSQFWFGQMPGVNFWSDKCLESTLVRTNARRTNACSKFLVGQMPRVNFWTDKCLEDKCLDGQMPVQAFVLRGICLSRHLSANR